MPVGALDNPIHYFSECASRALSKLGSPFYFLGRGELLFHRGKIRALPKYPRPSGYQPTHYVASSGSIDSVSGFLP